MDINRDSSVIGGADEPAAIFLAGDFGSLFFILAVVIMLFFYSIYFAKEIAQKRRGIRTRQLAERGKEKNIRLTEAFLSAATLLIIPIEFISIVEDWSMMPLLLRAVGAVVGLTGDLIFLAAVQTMKDSWRAGIPKTDKTKLVRQGIYLHSRNPAFLGFDLMYIGILLMYFNWILLLFTMWVIIMLHLQVLQEENYLETVFGERYLQYKRTTRRYWGRTKIIYKDD